MATYYIKNKGKGLNAVKSCCAENSSTLQRVKELFLLTLTQFQKSFTPIKKNQTVIFRVIKAVTTLSLLICRK